MEFLFHLVSSITKRSPEFETKLSGNQKPKNGKMFNQGGNQIFMGERGRVIEAFIHTFFR